MSLIETHPIALGALLFGFAYLNSRVSTVRDTRAAHREFQSGVRDDEIGKRREL